MTKSFQETNISFFPSQKKSRRQKTQDWFRECVDAAENITLLSEYDNSIRHKMRVWEDLYDNILDVEEIEDIFNPMGLDDAVFPAAIKNYPLSRPKVDLLVGEESKRRFEWSVVNKNEDAYSARQSTMKDMLVELVMEEIQNESYDEDDFQKKLGELNKYFNYEFRDLHELTANRILDYLYREQNLKIQFNRGFKEGLVKSREVYRIDIVGGKPMVITCDPRNIFSIRRGDSPYIEDSDIIVDISYEPIGKVVDEYHDYLSEKEVRDLEEDKKSGKENKILGYEADPPVIYSSLRFSGFSPIEEMDNNHSSNDYALPYDDEGNIRVMRVRWLGRRKIGRLTYFDEDGTQQEKLVDEQYKPNEFAGESVKWFWINEAYEGTKIGQDIYTKLGAREIQMRHTDNPSLCFLGYIGTDYGESLMGMMESYQYQYNVYMRRLELAIAKYKGPIYELDVSKIPDNWELNKWMYYAEILGWAPIDPFNEGKKGAATGKLAGHFNTTGKVLDADVGNYIQQMILMLQFIERQMGQIAGVTAQREGQTSSRETLGGIERAVVQSSHITEKWFLAHDDTKRRVLTALLDTAKFCWRNKPSMKLNYILDDMSRVMLDFSGEDLASQEFGLFVSDSADDLEVKQSLKQLAHAAVQNGASLSIVADVLRDNSISSMARKIEAKEIEAQERAAQAQQRQLEVQQQMQQAEIADKEADRELKYYEIDKKAEIELMKAQMASEDKQMDRDLNNNRVPDDIDQKKLRLQEQKQKDDTRLKESQLKETSRHNKAVEKKNNSK